MLYLRNGCATSLAVGTVLRDRMAVARDMHHIGRYAWVDVEYFVEILEC